MTSADAGVASDVDAGTTVPASAPVALPAAPMLSLQRWRQVVFGQHAIVIGLVVLIALLFGGILVFLRTPVAEKGLADRTRVIIECIDKFTPQFKRPDTAEGDPGAAFGICYSIVSSSLLAEEQENRNGSYILQKSENVVLMWMVVVITVSGVILAGLQLLASFELAKAGKGLLADGGGVAFRPGNVVVQSSVVGVVILAISFAFFMVFVVDVYRVEEVGAPQRPAAAAASSAGGNIGQAQGKLRPAVRAPVEPDSKPAEPK